MNIHKTSSPSNDGFPGGVASIDFDTLTLTTLPGTAVCGRVFASELASAKGASDPLNIPLEGVRITVDGMEATLFAETDAFGNFRLEPAPVGKFFVHIDGRAIQLYGHLDNDRIDQIHIHDNLIAGLELNNIVLGGSDGGTDVIGTVEVFNNIVLGSGEEGLRVNDPNGTVLIQNNVFYNNGSAQSLL